MAEKFKYGDIVISRNGRYPARVNGVIYEHQTYIDVVYLHNGKYSSLNKYNLIHYNGAIETMTTNSQLFSFVKDDGTTGYGTYLTTTSSGDWLVEEKGPGDISGTIHVKPKTAFTEVVPYTFSVKVNNRELHFVCEEGKVKKGDVLLYTGGNEPAMVVVTRVDTKSKTAIDKFSGSRIKTDTF
jgi:hypothetical protein